MGKKKFAPEPKSKRDLGSGAEFLFFFWVTIDPLKSARFFLNPKGLRKKTAKSTFVFFLVLYTIAPEKGVVFFLKAEDGIRDSSVTGVQTCALLILSPTRT